MSTNFPTSLDNGTTLPNPTGSSTLASPDHAGLHDNENAAIIATQTKLGTGSSTPSSTNLLVSTGTGTSAWSKLAPAGTIVGTSDSQNLTNKTLTSPTINAAIISNPTLTVDTISGFSTSTIGTAYGLGINNGAITPTTVTASGLITASNGFTLSSGTLTLSNNSITAPMLATSAITLGYQPMTAGNFTTTSTTPVQVTGLTTTVTIPAGGRRVKITFYCEAFYNAGSGSSAVTIWDGFVNNVGGSGTQLQQGTNSTPGSAPGGQTIIAIVTPAAGSKTYNIGFRTSTGTGTIESGTTFPAFILVEAI